MASANRGDRVRVHLEGRLENGEVVCSTRVPGPFCFVLGKDRVLPGLFAGILGMSVGQTRNFEVSPEKGHGAWRRDLVFAVDRSCFPEDVELFPGKTLRLEQPGGRSFSATIKKVGPRRVVVDANHPLAGKKILFTAELLEIG
ncbi:MAG: FKBP-type peptidyl-prolyl cis-trans isomerase [Deltaproteobacteria bacterium]|nr:FKBP-type peptidyl-prolyl cis-trans isomerase [Deltaproteobacteria bacterium]